MSQWGAGAAAEAAQGEIHHTRDRALRVSLVWPFLAIAVILYGSLLPFRFNGPAARFHSLASFLPSAWRGTTTEDFLTNILVYVPLGLAVVLCGNRRRCGWAFLRLNAAMVIGAIVSVLAESLQNVLSARVSSLTDVALNLVGTGLGAILGIGAASAASLALPKWRAAWRREPFAVMGWALTLGLLLYGLAPFDFVTDSAALHDSFRRARWDITRLRPVGLGEPPLAAVVAQCVAAAWYAALGYVTARSREPRGYTPGLAWAAGVKHGLTLACLVELMQLFTRSHQFDLASAVIRGLGVVFGAWYAVSTADRQLNCRDGVRVRVTIDPPLLLPLVAAQIMALLASSFHPALFSIQQADPVSVLRLPFDALWHRPMAAAAAEIGSDIVTYAALSASVAMLLARARMRRVWIGTVVTVVSTALGVEVLQLCTPSRHADPTGPVMAMFSVFLVSRWLPTLASPKTPDLTVQMRPETGTGVAVSSR